MKEVCPEYRLRVETPPALPLSTLVSTFTPGSSLDYDAGLCEAFFRRGDFTRSLQHLQKVTVSDDSAVQRQHGAMQQLLLCVTMSRMSKHEEALAHAQHALAVFENLLESLAQPVVGNQIRSTPWQRETIRGKLFARECVAIEEEFLGISAGEPREFGLALPEIGSPPRLRSGECEEADIITFPSEEAQKKSEREHRKQAVLNELNELGAIKGLPLLSGDTSPSRASPSRHLDTGADADTSPTHSVTVRHGGAVNDQLKVIDDNIEHDDFPSPRLMRSAPEPAASEQLRVENIRVATRYFPDDRKLCKIMATSMQRFRERTNTEPGDLDDFRSVTSEDRRKWLACAKIPQVAATHSTGWTRANGALGMGRAKTATPLAVRNPMFFLDENQVDVKQSKEKDRKGCLFQNFKLDTQTHLLTCSRPPTLDENIWWTKKDLQREKVVLRNRIKEKDGHTLHDEKVRFSETGRWINKRAEMKKKLRDFSRRNDSDEAKKMVKKRDTLFASFNVKNKLYDQFRDTSYATSYGLGIGGRKIRDGKVKTAETESLKALSKLLDKSCEHVVSHWPKSEVDGLLGNSPIDSTKKKVPDVQCKTSSA